MGQADDYKKRFHNNNEKTEEIYSGKLVNLKIEHVKDNNEIKKYEIVNHPNGVSMIPVTKDGNIILIKQYRRALDSVIIEIPAGILEIDESPNIAANRELQEEIGYKSNKLTLLGKYFLSPGFCNEHMFLFLAQDLTKSSLEKDGDEFFDIFEVTEKEALDLIKNNKINDIKTSYGILHYLNWKKLFTKN